MVPIDEMRRNLSTVLAFRTPARDYVALEGSVLALDDQVMPGYPISAYVRELLITSNDHIETLRVVIEDLGALPSHSGWTLMRSAIETSSRALWLCQPDEQDERMRRLFRHVQDDFDRWAEVVRESKPVRQRGEPIAGQAERQRELDQLAAPYVSSSLTLQNQVREKVNIVETIRDAATASKVSTPKHQVASLWRRASGFSHGMPWAHNQSSQTQQIGDTGVNLTGTDPRFLSKMVGITMGIAHYTDWLVSSKSGVPYDLAEGEQIRYTSVRPVPGV
jgi:hypothetical protein